MDAVTYIKEFRRMCNTFTEDCSVCPVKMKDWTGCLEWIDAYPNQAVAIVEKWSKENPAKTNADKFKEVFGNVASRVSNAEFGLDKLFLPLGWLDAPYETPKEDSDVGNT